MNSIGNNSGWHSFNTDCTMRSANNYDGKSSEGETYQACEIAISVVLYFLELRLTGARLKITLTLSVTGLEAIDWSLSSEDTVKAARVP